MKAFRSLWLEINFHFSFFIVLLSLLLQCVNAVDASFCSQPTWPNSCSCWDPSRASLLNMPEKTETAGVSAKRNLVNCCVRSLALQDRWVGRQTTVTHYNSPLPSLSVFFCCICCSFITSRSDFLPKGQQKGIGRLLRRAGPWQGQCGRLQWISHIYGGFGGNYGCLTGSSFSE